MNAGTCMSPPRTCQYRTDLRPWSTRVPQIPRHKAIIIIQVPIRDKKKKVSKPLYQRKHKDRNSEKASLEDAMAREHILEALSSTWRNKLNGAAQGGEYDLLLWWGSVVYITSRKRTVRLGSLLGLMRVTLAVEPYRYQNAHTFWNHILK